MNASLEYRKIPTNGIHLHVALSGPETGETVILLHGFPEFWAGWRKQIGALAGQGYRVIVPDQRGYNLSDVPARVEDYSLDILSADILGLMDHFGLEKVYLVGHDWGAMVAWTIGLKHPERIRKLVIMNVPHPAVMTQFLSKSPRQMLKSWYIGFFQIPGLADWLLSRSKYSPALGIFKNSGHKNSFSASELEEYRQSYINSNGLTGMLNWYRALVRYRPELTSNIYLSIPVLILWGRKDVALSPEMAEESIHLCKNGELYFFDNATHWVQHDESEAVNQYLLKFFKD